jgi:hypothetical protein
MNFLFPLEDVAICQKATTLMVKDPLHIGETWQVSQNEFAMQLASIGDFYVRDGNYVEVSPADDADPDMVKLCLSGRIMVALLHQRKIISFHASSFSHNDRGIMILGETGSGKSSLTASFAMNGAGFLSDDMTPVIMKESKPYIWPLHRSIKISENTVGQLNISRHKLTQAERGTGKQYLHIDHAGVKDHILNTILKIEVGNNSAYEFYKPDPAGKFSLLRSEICSWEILAGMPETEAEYLHQILQIIQQVNFVKVVRPVEIEIQRLHAAIADYLKIGE